MSTELATDQTLDSVIAKNEAEGKKLVSHSRSASGTWKCVFARDMSKPAEPAPVEDTPAPAPKPPASDEENDTKPDTKKKVANKKGKKKASGE